MNLNKIIKPTLPFVYNDISYDILTPNVELFNKISQPINNDKELRDICKIILINNKQNVDFPNYDDIKITDIAVFFYSYVNFLTKIKNAPYLKVPFYPEQENDIKYSIETFQEKIVSDYSGLNFFQIQELDIIDFWLLLRNAVIFNRTQSKEGREYLDKCWILEQTEPDRIGLRKKFGGNK